MGTPLTELARSGLSTTESDVVFPARRRLFPALLSQHLYKNLSTALLHRLASIKLRAEYLRR